MQEKGEYTSYYLVSQLLKGLGYKKRRYSKDQCLSNPENRDAQFNKIAALKRAFSEADLPVLSIDTKQKEMLGNFDRANLITAKKNARCWTMISNPKLRGLLFPTGYTIALTTKVISLWARAKTPPRLSTTTSCFIGNKIYNGFTPKPTACCCFVMGAVPMPACTIL